ncbi:TetR/AcrR family transcriptional regulator [Rhodococcus sp. 14-2470-1a]|uniref:TetR/AcrR family transcriptional regulator n=1 Tax=Rhodococcus sp. 14-2470-1a TaxID=2023150 RepID=UPI000B9B7A88|nr:TetR family transcriptional regulator [Rhodococcus sp. 14-2470-1a]
MGVVSTQPVDPSLYQDAPIKHAPIKDAPIKHAPFKGAVSSPMRTTILDGLHDLLLERTWSTVNMADVAKAAGISRQTLYKEFGTRKGLAQGYALRLTDSFVSAVDDAVYANEGDSLRTLYVAFTEFFGRSASDPLVLSMLTDDPPPDLLRLVTTESGALIEHASLRLASTFERSWLRASAHNADVLGRTVVRLALSYISMPPENSSDVAADLASLLTPFVDAIKGTA